MEIEFYNEHKHDYFLDKYRKYSREPESEEKEFFKPLLEEIVEDIAEVMNVSTDFKLYFGMTDASKLSDDAPINRYVRGFSYPSWMEGVDIDFIMMRAVRNREHWQECLANMLAHEIAHQEFYGQVNKEPSTNGENIIFEGYAMIRAEEVTQAMNINWHPHYRSEEEIKISTKVVIDVLDQDLTWKSEGIFNRGEEPCQDAEGYNISYQVVKDILQRTNLKLEELPNASKEELREEVEISLKNVLA